MFKLARIKRPKSIKVRSQHYIKNRDEPKDDPSRDASTKNEAVLVQDSPDMRRDFRSIAKRIRIIKIHGLKKKYRDNG